MRATEAGGKRGNTQASEFVAFWRHLLTNAIESLLGLYMTVAVATSEDQRMSPSLKKPFARETMGKRFLRVMSHKVWTVIEAAAKNPLYAPPVFRRTHVSLSYCHIWLHCIFAPAEMETVTVNIDLYGLLWASSEKSNFCGSLHHIEVFQHNPFCPLADLLLQLLFLDFRKRIKLHPMILLKVLECITRQKPSQFTDIVGWNLRKIRNSKSRNPILFTSPIFEITAFKRLIFKQAWRCSANTFAGSLQKKWEKLFLCILFFLCYLRGMVVIILGSFR